MSSRYENPKVDELLAEHCPSHAWSEDDYRDLAIAALDQGGVSPRDQKHVLDILGMEESDASYLARTGEPRGAGDDWAGRERGDFCE